MEKFFICTQKNFELIIFNIFLYHVCSYIMKFLLQAQEFPEKHFLYSGQMKILASVQS